VTYLAPHEALTPGLEVLQPETSRKLLQLIHPDLIFSGHTHTLCVKRHLYENRSSIEVTVPTFSWRMRPDPSFATLGIDKTGKVQIKVSSPFKNTIQIIVNG